MDNRAALDPHRSVVVEACAGSGKTWLLVSRVVRLLLDGVPPGEILAITFTRKAAQEMQARLRDWLYELASADDEQVRDFLRQRALGEHDIERLLPCARGLYQQFLLASPSITISTFHGWFMQILQRAPIGSGNPGGVQLVEQIAELWNEAWQTFLDGLHSQPDSETSQSMTALFGEFGLSNTQALLHKFADKRSDWWAYTAGQHDPLGFALEKLRCEFAVDLGRDPLAELVGRTQFVADVRALAGCLAGLQNASAAQKTRAVQLLAPLDGTLPPADVFAHLWEQLFTRQNTPRSIKENKGQDGASLKQALEIVRGQLSDAYGKAEAQQLYLFNCHALRCGVALLDAYQSLKRRQQKLDFGDLEWRVCQLLSDSDHAEYLQYKLDSRYRHVLLDEFQDTNPLQWQILQSWFDASKAVDSQPTVFVVGDPKQSIYRFRRADARLFDVVRGFLQDNYQAVHIKNNETRRNAPAVLNALNGVFDGLPGFAGFEPHCSHQYDLPGHVAVLPLTESARVAVTEEAELRLRNPLLEAYPESEEDARDLEARQFAERIGEMVGVWQIRDGELSRAVAFSDIMVLVRRRTYLKVYEHALRRRAIPFLTSRRGGLLDTLEATDIQALLTFLITPFADLALAQSLRTPIFSCSDDDLMRIQDAGSWMPDAGESCTPNPESRIPNPESRILSPGSWWQRLRRLVENENASPALQRAHRLLQGWLLLADKLPVHDLLDRIYFEGDAKQRYSDSVPEAMRATVLANLQAFLEIALNVDAGRYPSLPGFLRELAELREAADNESPDEGKVSLAGNAVRIYTVHEAKGLEAPIVWLLDANVKPPSDLGYDVLVDWPTSSKAPAHFSLYADRASRGEVRKHYFEQEAALAQREDLNLLYVAMTRAKQALLVSGNGERIEASWYDRIAAALTEAGANPLLGRVCARRAEAAAVLPVGVDERLCKALPTGKRMAALSDAQRHGIRLHGLLQHLATPEALFSDDLRGVLQRKLNIPSGQMDELWKQAHAVLSAPGLARYFDPRHYLSAANEIGYVDADGQVRRIDRLVEFEDEVWVLDYKTGDVAATHAYAAQLEAYRAAMQAIHPAKPVRCALIFADGKFVEV